MLDETLPPDSNNCTTPPEVIIRHGGFDQTAWYYFLKDKQAVNAPIDNGILNLFHPDKVLYMYDPQEREYGCPLHGHSLLTYTTVSPDPNHYKEFTKQCGVLKKYMPV